MTPTFPRTSRHPGQSGLERLLTSQASRKFYTIFFYHWPPVLLIILGVVSTRLSAIYAAVTTIRWSPDHFLKVWFVAPRTFREALLRTNAVICGPQTYNYFRGVTDRTTSLDVFVRTGMEGPLLSFMRRLPNSIPLSNTHYFGSAPPPERFIRLTHQDTFPVPEYRHLCTFSFTIARDRSSPGAPLPRRMVNIFHVPAEPVTYLIRKLPFSAMMNFVFADRAISLFPRSTFEEGKVIPCDYNLQLSHIHHLWDNVFDSLRVIQKPKEMPSEMLPDMRSLSDDSAWLITFHDQEFEAIRKREHLPLPRAEPSVVYIDGVTISLRPYRPIQWNDSESSDNDGEDEDEDEDDGHDS
ncbi:hypothetical protein PLICRDRAFT_176938 [Plicaturopsis crispa FD-325 SS-3]|nr:hypothetical protein PLICRDRAFT_176938 [Plicaturopsis crispa FD-325 SS-3]